MRDRLKVGIPVIVEGKYDKIKLESVIDADIITTDGFGLFKDKEKSLMILRIAEKNGVIVLTDADGGGLVIRNRISSLLPKDKVINLYIPEIKGREKRKDKDSAQGLLGVEGVDPELLYKLFLPFSETGEGQEKRAKVTKTDLYSDGLSGTEGSRALRTAFCKMAQIPTNISANSLLEVINLLYGYEGYKKMLESIKGS